MRSRTIRVGGVLVGAASLTVSSIGVAAAQIDDEERGKADDQRRDELSLPRVDRSTPEGFKGAERAEGRLEELGWTSADLEEHRAGVAARLNEDTAQKLEELRAGGAEIGQSNAELTGDDLVSYIVEDPDGGRSIVTAPASYLVHEDGGVHVPDVDDATFELSAPTWSGDWASLSSWNHSRWYYDSPSWTETPECLGEMSGEVRTKVWRRKLQSGGSYDYYGHELQFVAELVGLSGGTGCNNFIDKAEGYFRHNSSSTDYHAQSPSTLPGTNCQAETVSVGVSVGAVSGDVSQTFTRCENWDVTGYLASSGSSKYAIDFENNNSCSSEDRVGAMAWVTKVPDGGSVAGTFGGTMDPDQEPGNCCSSCGG